jgi:hypothetical protein
MNERGGGGSTIYMLEIASGLNSGHCREVFLQSVNSVFHLTVGGLGLETKASAQ